MREIKFRAWDNLKKEMIAEGYHVIGEVTMFGLIDQWVDEHRGDTPSLEYYNHVIESQFTGLKDKNGKEIYEGDIIRFKCGARLCPYINVSIEWSDRWVTYITNAKMAGALETLDECYYYSDKDVEVIGNIYENPDLLNSDKEDKRSVARDDDSSTSDNKQRITEGL